jgi:hypothetical protein
MITVEIQNTKDGDCNIITILDDTGSDNDLEVSWSPGDQHLFMRQERNEHDVDVIAMTPKQAYLVYKTLRAALNGDE